MRIEQCVATVVVTAVLGFSIGYAFLGEQPMKQHTTPQYQIEMLALELWRDNLRIQPNMPQANDHPMEQGTELRDLPTPRWAEVGLNIRNAYRQAARELLAEHN